MTVVSASASASAVVVVVVDAVGRWNNRPGCVQDFRLLGIRGDLELRQNKCLVSFLCV